MPFRIRKLVIHKDVTFREGGKDVGSPVEMVAVAAVIDNPWFGRGFVDDLSPEQNDGCGPLGQLIASRIADEIGDAASIQAYGKCAAAGAGGEIEHAAAVIHNLRFGDRYRALVGAKTYLAFTNKRGGLGTSLQIPMLHIHESGTRSHFVTMEFSIADAPGANELVVALAASSGGRPHARIGDRRLDAVEMARESETLDQQA